MQLTVHIIVTLGGSKPVENALSLALRFFLQLDHDPKVHSYIDITYNEICRLEKFKCFKWFQGEKP